MGKMIAVNAFKSQMQAWIIPFVMYILMPNAMFGLVTPIISFDAKKVQILITAFANADLMTCMDIALRFV